MLYKVVNYVQKSNKLYYCTKSAPNKKSYTNTILLPKTTFPLRLENQKLVERDEYIYNVSI